MSYLSDTHEARKARLNRFNAAAARQVSRMKEKTLSETVQNNNSVNGNHVKVDQQVIACLREQVSQLKAALVIKNEGSPQVDVNPWLPPEPPGPPPITISKIKKAVTAHYGLSLIELDSQQRDRRIVLPRQIAMYLCTRLTLRSLPFIGEHFGNKDHTTVLHARETIGRRRKEDAGLNAELVEFERKITEQ